MADQAKKVFKMMENSPLPALIKNLGTSVAEAQYHMDMFVAKSLKILANKDEYGVEIPGYEEKKSLLELGFLPSFYHFSEVNLNVKLALSSMEGEEIELGAEASFGKPGVFGVSLNASYSNKYSFSANASSEFNTKIVSIPPPPILNELLQEFGNKQRKKSSS